MVDQKEQIENYVQANLQEELAQEQKRADAIAKLVIDFAQNGQGEELANVHTSQAFQEVYDYRGSEKVRWRLDRKKEQIAAGYDAGSQLFQKVYYAKDLLLDDERQLRSAFTSAESGYNFQRHAGAGTLFLAYFPLTYKLAARVKPASLILWTGAYYFGLYKQGLLPATSWAMQQSLNRSARPFAAKYNIAC